MDLATATPKQPPKVQTRSSSELAKAPTTEEASDAPAVKRARVDPPGGEPARHVLLIPTDDPFRPMLVDRTLLRMFDCRTGAMLEHQPPEQTIEGRPAWPTYMSRAMLGAFMRALQVGSFCQPRGVDEHEVTSTFEYEGIAIPGNSLDAATSPEMQLALPGLGTNSKHDDRVERVERTMTQALHAIVTWPRLELGLQRASEGKGCGFACTRNRVWIGFTPVLASHGGAESDAVYCMAKRRPPWLRLQLEAFGLVHYYCGVAKRLDPEARDETAFVKLARAIETDATSHFLACKRDWPQAMRHDATHQPAGEHSTAFALSVFNCVANHGADKGGELPVPVQYARACITVAERMLHELPDMGRMLSGSCVATTQGYKGKDKLPEPTPERKAFERACKTHGIRVLEWRDCAPTGIGAYGVKPLCFPPLFHRSTGSDHEVRVCALLEREDTR